jgi:hypothetical protein
MVKYDYYNHSIPHALSEYVILGKVEVVIFEFSSGSHVTRSELRTMNLSLRIIAVKGEKNFFGSSCSSMHRNRHLLRGFQIDEGRVICGG